MKRPTRPSIVRVHRDPYGEGWLTQRDGRPGYLIAPHYAAHCPCGARKHARSPLCWECHLAILGVTP